MKQMIETRREFLKTASMLAATPFINIETGSKPGSYGIAYTSFPIRTRQARERAGGAGGQPLPAEDFISMCRNFGAAGCQMDISQLSNTDSEYLKKIRAQLEKAGMWLELAVRATILEDDDLFSNVAATASQLGVSRLRIACLSGRRYENYDDPVKWKEFADRWKRAMHRAEPSLKKHKLLVGVENHKDWTADEHVELLKGVGSPYLGACVDFGNNIAMLEDELETTEKLAPYVVTTHLKDMAVRRYEDGFELSEVALGKGNTPLAQIVTILRRHRSDVHFCLEMITRDPLKVPYKTEKYWATIDNRDDNRVKTFERRVLSRSSESPLPRITGLSPAQALDVENDNVRTSSNYAINELKL